MIKKNDYINIPNSNDWDFGSGDFTIDFWIKWSKWALLKTHMQILYIKYILYNWFKILKKFKLIDNKLNFEEYLDIKSFK